MRFRSHMDLALAEARAAATRGDVPVGAVIVAPSGVVAASAGNRTRGTHDPTAHAEILALRAACAAAGSERLPGFDLYVTLEPCAMCAAAISFARIGRLYYGAADPKSGGVAAGARVFAHPQCHHVPEIYDGLAADEAETLLREFFAGAARTMTVILFNKPYGVLSQFTDDGPAGSARVTLAAFIDAPGVYPAGRLDRDSEGLLVLTDDGRLQARIADPRYKRSKTYLAQVEGVPGDDQVAALAAGVTLKDGPTRPARVRTIAPPPLWPRDPPIRARKTVPDAWLEIALTEGRNRQVRRMCAHVGLPCLRLVRWAVDGWTLEGLAPGAWRRL